MMQANHRKRVEQRTVCHLVDGDYENARPTVERKIHRYSSHQMKRTSGREESEFTRWNGAITASIRPGAPVLFGSCSTPYTIPFDSCARYTQDASSNDLFQRIKCSSVQMSDEYKD
jgi:hypothetical protein